MNLRDHNLTYNHNNFGIPGSMNYFNYLSDRPLAPPPKALPVSPNQNFFPGYLLLKRPSSEANLSRTKIELMMNEQDESENKH